MRFGTRWVIAVAAGIATIIAVLVGAGAISVNLGFARDTIAEIIEEQTGARLVLGGTLRLRLGLAPRLEASRIAVHLAGGTGAPAVFIDDLEIAPYLLDLFAGRLHFRVVAARQVAIDYCTGWASSPSPRDGAGRPSLPSIAVDELSIEDVLPACHDRDRVRAYVPERLDIEARAPLHGPLRLRADAELRDGPVSLAASGAPLMRLLEGKSAYPVQARIRAFDSELTVKGQARDLWQAPTLDGRMDLKSSSLSKLVHQLGIAASVPSGNDGARLSVDGVFAAREIELRHAEVLALNHRVWLSGVATQLNTRPQLELKLRLEQLDLDALAPVLSIERPPEAQRPPGDLQPLYSLLRRVDGAVTVQIDRASRLPWIVNEIEARASLHRGRLEIPNLDLAWEGAHVTGSASLNLEAPCPAFSSELHVANVDLAAARHAVGWGVPLDGKLQALGLTGSACGETTAELLDTSEAKIGLNDLRATVGSAATDLAVSRAAVELGWKRPVAMRLEGELRGQPVRAELTLDAPGHLASGKAWPLDLTVQSRTARLRARGEGRFGEEPDAIEAEVSLTGDRFGDLLALAGAEAREDLPFSFRSTVRLERDRLELSRLQATLGSSDLNGTLKLRPAQAKEPSEATLQSHQLNIAELAGLFPEERGERRNFDALSIGTEPQADWIDRWFGFPVIEVELAVDRMHGIDFDLTDAAVHGHLRDRRIEDGRLRARFEGIDVNGTVNIDLRGEMWKTRYLLTAENIDAGRLLARLDLAENVKLSADQLHLSLEATGRSLLELASNLRAQGHIRSLRWLGTAGASEKPYELELSELDVIASPSQPFLWTSEGNLNGTPLKLWMQTPRLRQISNSQRTRRVALVAGLGNSVTTLAATIEPDRSKGLTVQVDMSGALMDPLGLDFSHVVGPLDGYRLESTVQIQESAVRAADVRARIGASYASGNLDVRREGDHYHVNGNLTAPFLETNDLVEWLQAIRAVQEADQETATVEPSQVSQPTIRKRPFVLINEFIDGLTERNTIDLEVSIDQLYAAGEAFGDARLRLSMDKDGVSFDPLWIDHTQGTVQATYHSQRLGSESQYDLDVDIEELAYEGFLKLINADSTAAGKLFLDLSVAARASQAANAAENLQGYLDLVVFPENVSAGFLDLWASNLILALLPSPDGREKVMNCMVARFEVEDGVMHTRKVFLDSTDIIVRARGKIDLASQKLDLLIVPQAKRERFLSISTPLAVTGSFDDFRVYPAPSRFLTTLIRLYYGIIYVPWKWLTGSRFPADGIETCYNAMDWELPEGAAP